MTGVSGSEDHQLVLLCQVLQKGVGPVTRNDVPQFGQGFVFFLVAFGLEEIIQKKQGIAPAVVDDLDVRTREHRP